MTASGTYNFGPANSSLALAAYERIQIRAPSIRQEHMFSAQREMNFLMSQFSNLQPNLWTVTLITTDLTDGTKTYDVNAKVVMILDAFISLNYGDSDQTDRYITPLSRTEYASIASKSTEGQPTVFWFNRQISPTITLWPVPDADSTYTLVYYACTQMQDINLAGGETPDLPYRWYDAMVAGLSYRLARIYAPQLENVRKQDAQDAWTIAATQDVENTALVLAPMMAGYFP